MASEKRSKAYLQRKRRKARQVYQERRDNFKCGRCRKPSPERALCPACGAERNEAMRRYRRAEE